MAISRSESFINRAISDIVNLLFGTNYTEYDQPSMNTDTDIQVLDLGTKAIFLYKETNI